MFLLLQHVIWIKQIHVMEMLNNIRSSNPGLGHKFKPFLDQLKNLWQLITGFRNKSNQQKHNVHLKILNITFKTTVNKQFLHAPAVVPKKPFTIFSNVYLVNSLHNNQIQLIPNYWHSDKINEATFLTIMLILQSK